MAIEFVGTTSASTTTLTLTMPVPPGAQAGDLWVMVLRSWTYPVANIGWGALPAYGVVGPWVERIVNTSRGGGSNLYVFTGFVDPASTDQPLIYFSGNGNHHATILSFRGVDVENPVNAVAQAYSSSGANNITPSVTTTVPNCMVVRAVAAGFSLSNGSCSWVSTVDELTDTRSSAGYSYISTAKSIEPFPGTGVTATATYSTAGYGIMATLALAPKRTSRLHLGGNPVPLMLGATEVEVMGP
ncbi:hypothetical protein GS534_00445 [Rhodococcus hoagii]|nr:hypothetical protein [Prescottella equi]